MNRATRFHKNSLKNELNQLDVNAVAKRMSAAHFMRNYNNRSITENGAVGYRTTTQPLLDLNFQVSSLRNRDEKYIVNAFVEAYYADRKYAVKWLFFLRDVLEGLGERRTFRICLKHLAITKPQVALAVMELVPKYGRFDDLLIYLDTPLSEEACKFMHSQLEKDVEAMKQNKPASLLAKWLPSNNTSSKESRKMAGILAKSFGMRPGEYRKTLSELRAYLEITEVKISAKNWEQVDYEKVPAKANIKYDSAFLRHDKERRISYMEELLCGEGKINSKGLMPYEIVHRLTKGSYSVALKEDDLAEVLWKNLVKAGFENSWGLKDCIVVADGSGSMFTPVSGTSGVLAIEVCNSLAIYFASRLQGVFHDKAITFSSRPQFIDLGQGDGLRDKMEIMYAHNEVANTNIEAVFDMLLDMAISEQVPAEELPSQVLIISDMEFDAANRPDYRWRYTHPHGGLGDMDAPVKPWRPFNEPLFKAMEKKFQAAGYAMPRLIFWNVCGRTDTIPMVEGENGICLLSGFSQNAIKIASDREIKDPYRCLIKTLDSERYLAVEEALNGVA